MSWGADIIVDHGDGYTTTIEVVEGHTYNLTPMWREACEFPETIGTRWFDLKTCSEIKDTLLAALVDTWEHPEKYTVMNPDNGWGDFEGFQKILTRFTRLVHQHPTGVIAWNG